MAPAFSDLVRAWENWTPWILGYFDHPVTNAYTESLNNLIRVMNRLGRGYSFEALRAKILFAEGAHKHKNSRPKFERREKERIVAEPEAVDEELNRIVGIFKLAREQGYTLKLIPGTPEENAPVFDFENERIIRPAA